MRNDKLTNRNGGGLFFAIFAMWIVGGLMSLISTGAIIYIILHFVGKFW